MCTARLFWCKVDLFALKFHLDIPNIREFVDYVPDPVPINHHWRQKTSGTGLPGGKGRIHLRSFVLTQYRSVTDGRTDTQTDWYALAYTAVAKLALRRAVKFK